MLGDLETLYGVDLQDTGTVVPTKPFEAGDGKGNDTHRTGEKAVSRREQDHDGT